MQTLETQAQGSNCFELALPFSVFSQCLCLSLLHQRTLKSSVTYNNYGKIQIMAILFRSRITTSARPQKHQNYIFPANKIWRHKPTYSAMYCWTTFQKNWSPDLTKYRFKFCEKALTSRGGEEKFKTIRDYWSLQQQIVRCETASSYFQEQVVWKQ